MSCNVAAGQLSIPPYVYRIRISISAKRRLYGLPHGHYSRTVLTHFPPVSFISISDTYMAGCFNVAQNIHVKNIKTVGVVIRQ